jgi:hypothetical protein
LVLEYALHSGATMTYVVDYNKLVTQIVWPIQVVWYHQHEDRMDFLTGLLSAELSQQEKDRFRRSGASTILHHVQFGPGRVSGAKFNEAMERFVRLLEPHVDVDVQPHLRATAGGFFAAFLNRDRPDKTPVETDQFYGISFREATWEDIDRHGGTLSSQVAYTRTRQLVRERFQVATGSLAGEGLGHVAQAIAETGERIATLYLSNVLEHFRRPEEYVQLFDRLQQLPATDETLVLRTALGGIIKIHQSFGAFIRMARGVNIARSDSQHSLHYRVRVHRALLSNAEVLSATQTPLVQLAHRLGVIANSYQQRHFYSGPLFHHLEAPIDAATSTSAFFAFFEPARIRQDHRRYRRGQFTDRAAFRRHLAQRGFRQGFEMEFVDPFDVDLAAFVFEWLEIIRLPIPTLPDSSTARPQIPLAAVAWIGAAGLPWEWLVQPDTLVSLLSLSALTMPLMVGRIERLARRVGRGLPNQLKPVTMQDEDPAAQPARRFGGQQGADSAGDRLSDRRVNTDHDVFVKQKTYGGSGFGREGHELAVAQLGGGEVQSRSDVVGRQLGEVFPGRDDAGWNPRLKELEHVRGEHTSFRKTRLSVTDGGIDLDQSFERTVFHQPFSFADSKHSIRAPERQDEGLLLLVLVGAGALLASLAAPWAALAAPKALLSLLGLTVLALAELAVSAVVLSVDEKQEGQPSGVEPRAEPPRGLRVNLELSEDNIRQVAMALHGGAPLSHVDSFVLNGRRWTIETADLLQERLSESTNADGGRITVVPTRLSTWRSWSPLTRISAAYRHSRTGRSLGSRTLTVERLGATKHPSRRMSSRRLRRSSEETRSANLARPSTSMSSPIRGSLVMRVKARSRTDSTMAWEEPERSNDETKTFVSSRTRMPAGSADRGNLGVDFLHRQPPASPHLAIDRLEELIPPRRARLVHQFFRQRPAFFNAQLRRDALDSFDQIPGHLSPPHKVYLLATPLSSGASPTAMIMPVLGLTDGWLGWWGLALGGAAVWAEGWRLKKPAPGSKRRPPASSALSEGRDAAGLRVIDFKGLPAWIWWNFQDRLNVTILEEFVQEAAAITQKQLQQRLGDIRIQAFVSGGYKYLGSKTRDRKDVDLGVWYDSPLIRGAIRSVIGPAL